MQAHPFGTPAHTILILSTAYLPKTLWSRREPFRSDPIFRLSIRAFPSSTSAKVLYFKVMKYFKVQFAMPLEDDAAYSSINTTCYIDPRGFEVESEGSGGEQKH